MAYVIRNSGKSILKNFANVEQRVFAEERKLRVLHKGVLELEAQVDEKKEELRTLAHERTKQLLEMKDPQKEKDTLARQSNSLKKQITERQGDLESTIEREKDLPRSIAREVKKEQSRLAPLTLLAKELQKEVQVLKVSKGELEDFIQKEAHIKDKYIEEQEGLSKASRERQAVDKDIVAMKEWKLIRGKEMDDYYEYLKEYSGKLTSTLHRVQQITKLMNEGLTRENILIRMELPVDKNEIPF